MCALGKIASCELFFAPIISSDYIDDVNRVISIIESSDMEHSVGLLSTTVRGDKDRIFDMIREIYDTMDGTAKFTLDIKISNLCGCEV
jgi:uncharacterized protein YqgV (UPF0045/DUF77 family)